MSQRNLAHLAMLLAIVSCLSLLLHAETDLDAFMREVLVRRDDNWKKLQQYILDEREQIEVRGPSRQPIWGERREYTWYVRDGFFVRSPVRFNGVDISEAERRKYEAGYLRRAQERDRRAGQPPASAPQPATGERQEPDALPAVDGLLKQVREPQFVSSAYFLRFKFEAGKYALVGREKLLDREVMRIEYYPAELYTPRQQRRMAREHDPKDPRDAEIQRMLNKVAVVTLWIEPASHQIVKYTFDNIDFDFLPARWLVRLDTVRASMTMNQPFPDVWLPQELEFHVAADFASGRVDVRWSVAYYDYREPEVTTRIRSSSPR